MAYNSANLLLPALFFAARLVPLSHGLTISGIANITQIQIQGLMTCSATGNPALGGLLGAAGVLVSGTCNGGSGNLGMAVTNTEGFYVVTINALDGILFYPAKGLPCFATIKLPVTGTTCKLFLPTGTLLAPVSLLQVAQNLVGGAVAIFSAGPFQLLP